ncbi:MAG: VanZ family protein [Clostridia bacterium]
MVHRIARVFVALIMILIFYFSSQVSEKSAEVSSNTTIEILNIIPKLKDLPIETKQDIADNIQFVVRKLAHFSIYAALGFFAIMSVSKQHRYIFKYIIIAFLVCVFYASTDEIHQLFVAGRGCRLVDVGIDSLGAGFGFIVFYLLTFIKNKVLRKKAL